jgi:hypothetical protein
MSETAPQPDPLRKPRVFVDADVLFAGSASQSTHGASLVILRMGELTLIDAVTSEQVVIEGERNLKEKLPQILPAFRLLVDRTLRIVPDPAEEIVRAHEGLADPKDLPILVAALGEECPWLVTFNTRHFQPGHPAITVLRPGELVMEVRYLLARLGDHE